MKTRLGGIAILVTAVVGAAGVFAGPSNSAPPADACTKGPLPCWVALTATGPSPSRLQKDAGLTSEFANTDSVDGKFPGTVVTTAIRQAVTLTARTHRVRHGTPLTLHGRISWFDNNPDLPQEPFRVLVLARRGGRGHFVHVAGGRVCSSQGRATDPLGQVRCGWKLKVNPRVETTYIAKDAEISPFTVRIRKEQR